ncbi:leucine-rich repeat-containing protein 19 isoform X2 [Bombus terrestris]|nr:leucine-rich repeat-containing protein 19 isoform X2 [Bombus terrestris]XP_020718234.1 leucine-rich repeat-containing protein 19 isoform X2 [Bombus terrestris]XP_048270639.1 leucine-rich repeat-containing protein 19 isoform X2 [Bombus terrestris]XP_048270640.1 leucine-rich repeat-containing protein 19 isoform X2 [Bombus terrestris]
MFFIAENTLFLSKKIMRTERKLRRYDDVSQSLTHLSTISIQSCCKIRLHWRGNHEPQENAIISIRILTQQCSTFCVCDTWYGLERASCVGRHLYNIHTGAPNNMQALDLSDNVISLLSSFELADIGMTRLKYLNLSKNAISEIGLNAFDGLTYLTILDLSKNRLHDISDEVFERNRNLRILILSKNNFNSHVPKLRSSSLMELNLDSCQISHLPPDTFNGLTHVRRLDLSNNLMIQMSTIVVQTLHVLNKLSLEGNPWSCNKIMFELQTYLNTKNIEFDEVCGKKINVKKFEKMINLPTTSRSYHHLANASMLFDETKSVTEYNVSNTVKDKNLSTCEQMINQTHVVDYKPVVYWFLLLGFILGISSGLFISYIWLSRMYLCNRRYSYHEQFNDELITSQRLSLLDLYLQGLISSDRSLIESCPSTPPPQYRDVMLRPSLYPPRV